MTEKRVQLLAHQYSSCNDFFYYLYIPSKVLKTKNNSENPGAPGARSKEYTDPPAIEQSWCCCWWQGFSPSRYLQMFYPHLLFWDHTAARRALRFCSAPVAPCTHTYM